MLFEIMKSYNSFFTAAGNKSAICSFTVYLIEDLYNELLQWEKACSNEKAYSNTEHEASQSKCKFAGLVVLFSMQILIAP